MNFLVEYIEWIDSMGSGSGWQSFKDLKDGARVARIRSVGIVVHENDDGVTLLQSLDDQEGNAQKGDNFITIPKISISSRVVLTEAEKNGV